MKQNKKTKAMTKQITIERINNAIIAILMSPNKSAQRAALWVKLQNMKKQYKAA